MLSEDLFLIHYQCKVALLSLSTENYFICVDNNSLVMPNVSVNSNWVHPPPSSGKFF